MIVSIIFGNDKTQFIKPIFHLFLVIYYTLNVKKFNPLIVLFLSLAMVGEFLTARNFIEYYFFIVILFALYFLVGFYLMTPIIKASKLKVQITDIYVGLIILIAFTYIVGSIYFVSAIEMNDFIFLFIATITFSMFVGACFYITGYHIHPLKIYFFIVGVGYMIVCVGALVYELILPSVYIQGFINLVEVIAQFSFIYVFAKFHKLIKNRQIFIQ